MVVFTSLTAPAVQLVMSFIFCAAKVQFFEKEHFEGKMYETTSSTTCTNLPTGFKNVNGSIKTTDCVSIFPFSNCSSSRLVIREKESQLKLASYKNEESHIVTYGYHVVSFRSCTYLESRLHGSRDLYKFEGNFNHVSTYGNCKFTGSTCEYNETQFRDVCTCTNLPYYSGQKEEFVRMFGNCLKFYKKENCIGMQTKITSEIIHHTSDRSVEPCHFPSHCVSLKASIFKLEPILNISDLIGSIKEVTLSAKQTYINDGTAQVEETYSAEKEVTQRAEFEYSQSLRQMKSITFTAGAAATVGGGVLGVSASATLSTELSKTSQTESGSGKRMSHAVTTKELFRVDKKVIIPGCTAYEAYSILQMAENIEVIYRIQFQISGETAVGKKLTSVDILQHLENDHQKLHILFGHPQANQFTVIAETTAKLKAKMGIESVFIGTGKPIPKCIERHSPTTEIHRPSTEQHTPSTERNNPSTETHNTSTENTKTTTDRSTASFFFAWHSSVYGFLAVLYKVVISLKIGA